MFFRCCSTTEQGLWLCLINFACLCSAVSNENQIPTSRVFPSALNLVCSACVFIRFGSGGPEGQGAKANRKATGIGTQDARDVGRGGHSGIESQVAREPFVRPGRRCRSVVDA